MYFYFGLTEIGFTDTHNNTVNSLMFAGINVCVFDAKPCLRGLIFAVISGLVSYLDTWIVCVVFIFAIYMWSRNSPNKSLTNINEFTVIHSIASVA